MSTDVAHDLLRRFDSVLARLGKLQVQMGTSREEHVLCRQLAVLNRVQRLEDRLGLSTDQPHGTKECSRDSASTSTSSCHKDPIIDTAKTDQVLEDLLPGPPGNGSYEEHMDHSPLHSRLSSELMQKGCRMFKYIRVNADYYSRPLSYSLVMENVKAHSSVNGWSNPNNSKYYLVIVQYKAAFRPQKLDAFVHSLNGGKLGKQWFKLRMAKGPTSDQLTGYTHNSVSPISLATPLPIILSDRIAKLQPGFFWVGAGETDLKVGMPVADFIRGYAPFVVDFTEDQAEGGDADDNDTAAVSKATDIDP